MVDKFFIAVKQLESVSLRYKLPSYTSFYHSITYTDAVDVLKEAQEKKGFQFKPEVGIHWGLGLRDSAIECLSCHGIPRLYIIGEWEARQLIVLHGDHAYVCMYVCICSAQFGNLHNLEIALRNFKIPKLCDNVKIA